MTTQAFSSRMRHDSDVTFQEWATELYDRLLLVGLIQTADTGQLDSPVVAARPGDATSAGYWIFRMNDTLQITAPIFFRFEVGTLLGASNSYPRIRCYVGTGSDGSGNLTGLLSSTVIAAGNDIIGFSSRVTDNAYPTLMCHTEGFFGMAYKGGSSPDPVNGLFMISRTCDASGNPTAAGAIAVWGQGSTAIRGVQSFRYSATQQAYRYNSSQADQCLGLVPQIPPNSTVGPDFQAYLAYTITPQVSPILNICGVYDSEVPFGTTFSATMVGTTPHTYIGTHYNMGIFGASTTVAVKQAFIWE